MDVRPDHQSQAHGGLGAAHEAPTVTPPGPAEAEPIPGPLPGPVPGPLPPRDDTLPLPQPLPPDWWRCHRLGSVSGRYGGEMTSPTAGRFYLDLRVDIDPRSTTSPVMERVSADLYQVFTLHPPFGKPITWRSYVESWVVDTPQERWSRCGVDITGRVRFWKGTHPATDAMVRVGWGSFSPAGPAAVTLTEAGGAHRVFSCKRVSDALRDLRMEVDVCASVNTAPLLPSYDTHWHDDRPVGLPQRVLTVESAYREAGVAVTIDPTHTVIDDGDSAFTSWTSAELHDAMETHFSLFGGAWPNWRMWGLLAGTFENPGVGGIMFDAAAAFGGAGEAPERQGFAVFRKHQWFNNLVAGAPANQDQAWAMRHYLYTWVHEAGHAFNFLHSWNKSRPGSLSWMNYDWRYDSLNGEGSFWRGFGFRFDDEELLHLRHGDRAAVIMGGDPWSSGGHMEHGHEGGMELAMAQTEGDAPLELLVRSKEYFEFMEPVIVELRLRNRSPDLPIPVDRRLSPEYGATAIYIQRPDGSVRAYEPVLCKLALEDTVTLAPARRGTPEGEDRHSREVFLAYGASGFYFDGPGEYRIRALYQGPGGMLIASNTHRLRVGTPASPEADRIAQDMFSDAAGMALYLHGSRSPFLAKGHDALQDVAERFQGSMLGARVAVTLARGLARPFFRMEPARSRSEAVAAETPPVRLKKEAQADPKRALELTEPAVKLHQGRKDKALNLAYGRLVQRRAALHRQTGKGKEAKRELEALQKDLAARGVHPSVVKTYEPTGDGGG